MTIQRYVAIGNSTTEGVGDERPDGSPRGWADRFAAALSLRDGGVLYANLAIRGRNTAQIRHEQAAPAVALRPDLITAVVGMNDLVATHFDGGAFDRDVDALFKLLRSGGATVLSSTLPDLTAIVPLPPRTRVAMRRRGVALNAVLTARGKQHGVRMLPLADLPAAVDRRIWRPDRLHPNPVGHAVLAEAMLQLLDGHEVTVTAQSQHGYGNVPYARAGAVASAGWAGRYVVPRTIRRLRGKSSGDGRAAKYADYERLVDGELAA